MGKKCFKSHNTSRTKTKCAGESEQQISPPLIREKLLFVTLCSSSDNSQEQAIRNETGKGFKNFWSANITDRKWAVPFTRLSLAGNLSHPAALKKLFYNPENLPTLVQVSYAPVRNVFCFYVDYTILKFVDRFFRCPIPY